VVGKGVHRVLEVTGNLPLISETETILFSEMLQPAEIPVLPKGHLGKQKYRCFL